MSTCAKAILMFGLYFDTQDAAMAHMRNNGYPEIMELYDEPEEDDKEG